MLHALFAPAMAIMSRLRFALKLGVVALLFLAPIAALVLYLYGKLNAEIETAKLERLGVSQIVPARLLVQRVAEHRAAAELVLNGDKAAKDGLEISAAKVDETLSAMSALDNATGVILKNRDSFANLSKQWSQIKSGGMRYTPEESFAVHSRLLDSVYGYMRTTADKSTLALNSDIDSFYIMNPTIFKFPTVLASVARLRALGSDILKRRTMTADEKTDVVVLQRFFYKDFNEFVSDYAKALSANAALTTTLGPKVKQAEEAAKGFLDNDVAPIVKGDFGLSPETYIKRGSIAYNSLYELFDTAMEQLDGLIAARIDRLKGNLLYLRRRRRVLLVVLYLFAGMLCPCCAR